MGTRAMAEATWIRLDEYNLADAMRITGANDTTIKHWMLKGVIASGEWREVADERGLNRAGYRIAAQALERIQNRRGKTCRWEAAQAGQVSGQVAVLLREREAKIAELEARCSDYSRRLGLTRRYGKDRAQQILASERGEGQVVIGTSEVDSGATHPYARTPVETVKRPRRDETSEPRDTSAIDEQLDSIFRAHHGPWRTPDGRELPTLGDALAAATSSGTHDPSGSEH